MTKRQKLELEQSEKRQALNALLSRDELTDDERGELAKLTTRMQELETELRAAIVAEAADESRRGDTGETGDAGETAELRALMGRASLSRYLMHAAAGTALTGAEAETNAALGIETRAGGTPIPWRMLDAGDGAGETRADAVTSTAALDGGTAQRPILQRLFGRDILGALGVRIDSVPAGMTEWPLLTGGAAPAQTAEGTAKDAEAATFAAQTLKPKRLTGAYQWTIEQAAQVPDLESALRRDLAAAVRAQMSDQALNGDGTGAEVTGILARIVAPDATGQTEATYADYAKLAAGAVDGIHAAMESEVSCILGVTTYRHAAGVFQTGSGEAGVEAIKRRSRACVATSFMAAAETRNTVTSIQDAILHAGGGGAMRGDSVAAMWPALEAIRDIYSGANEGKVRLQWVALWDAYLALRAGAYERVGIKVA